jgi:hypothetical protein
MLEYAFKYKAHMLRAETVLQFWVMCPAGQLPRLQLMHDASHKHWGQSRGTSNVRDPPHIGMARSSTYLKFLESLSECMLPLRKIVYEKAAQSYRFYGVVQHSITQHACRASIVTLCTLACCAHPDGARAQGDQDVR